MTDDQAEILRLIENFCDENSGNEVDDLDNFLSDYTQFTQLSGNDQVKEMVDFSENKAIAATRIKNNVGEFKVVIFIDDVNFHFASTQFKSLIFLSDLPDVREDLRVEYCLPYAVNFLGNNSEAFMELLNSTIQLESETLQILVETAHRILELETTKLIFNWVRVWDSLVTFSVQIEDPRIRYRIQNVTGSIGESEEGFMLHYLYWTPENFERLWSDPNRIKLFHDYFVDRIETDQDEQRDRDWKNQQRSNTETE